MATFNAYVHLEDEDGKVVIFEPGQKAPEWAVKKAGKHCFTEVKEEELEYAGPGMTQVDVQQAKAFAAFQAEKAEKAKADAEAQAAAEAAANAPKRGVK
jgi:hypothetical protein